MKLTYDLIDKQFYVGEQTLREFYIAARKEADISIGKLQDDSGLGHPTLHNIEKNHTNSIRALLIALETLGYSLDIQ